MKHTSLGFLILLFATSCAGPPVAELSHPESSQLFDLLDTGRDGSLSPFEALDALLVISEEGPLTRETLGAFLSEHADEELAARQEAWTPPELKHSRGYLADFAATVSQADSGCVSHWVT